VIQAHWYLTIYSHVHFNLHLCCLKRSLWIFARLIPESQSELLASGKASWLWNTEHLAPLVQCFDKVVQDSVQKISEYEVLDLFLEYK
jgi:hypothetical protein